MESSERHEDQLLTDEQRRYKALRQSGSVTSIANCNFQALYYMRNDLTDEAWYYFRIERPQGLSSKVRSRPSSSPLRLNSRIACSTFPMARCSRAAPNN